MANRYFKQFQHTLEKGVVELYGQVTFGSSGAISSQSCVGFSVAQTDSETGRYTVTLEDSYPKLLFCDVVLEGAADAAYTQDAGLGYLLRNVDVTSSKTFDIQLVDGGTVGSASQSDADPEDGAVAYIAIKLKNSELTY